MVVVVVVGGGWHPKDTYHIFGPSYDIIYELEMGESLYYTWFPTLIITHPLGGGANNVQNECLK